MGRAGSLALVAVAVALVVTAAVLVLRGVGPFPDPPGCWAEVDGRVVELSTEQAENAALIAAISVQRGLPARAASIALATAYQESDIRNLEYGDRDSLGLFQQRPSQGWGSRRQIQDPVYATNAFYDALVQVEGYLALEIAEAAQAVQRSAFPDAYADHVPDARALASALTGQTTGGGFHCVVDDDADEASAELGPAGLTPRAAAVRRELEAAFGELALGGFAPGGVSTGHIPGSAHYEGRAIDVFLRPVTPANRRRGWAVAGYLVAHADRLAVRTVIFDGRIWTARRSGEGWRDYDAPDRSGDPVVLEHRDHVHVDVAA